MKTSQLQVGDVVELRSGSPVLGKAININSNDLIHLQIGERVLVVGVDPKMVVYDSKILIVGAFGSDINDIEWDRVV